MIGTLFSDRYRLDAELGRGGMGVVYRAHDTVLGRDVALKVLTGPAFSPGGGTEPGTEGRARLLREARAVAQLDHPNIIAVHDAGEVDSVPFIVMQLVEGESLYHRPPTSISAVVSIARQVCAALEHAHAHGIVHRDLKPEHVLMTPDGTVKLVDFGLARTVASRLTPEGAIVGTAFYLAPEQALRRDIDGRADLYALGVMLYELTTGRLPFVADDPVAVISQHLHAPVVPPRARNDQIPPALDSLIVGLLSKDPADRPSSATQVLQVLGQPGFLDQDSDRVRELTVLERIERGRLVGRERELDEARMLWRQACAGTGQMLLVSGEPGIGKTRLVRELVTHVRVAGASVLVGECYAEGGGPYAPFAQILRRAFRNGAGERFAKILPDFVLADLLTLAPALRLRFPDIPANPSLDPQSEQQRLFENAVAFCTALSEQAPLLLVLEDAHWADSGSLALLRHLARRMRRQRVLLVATYREIELDVTRAFQEVLLDLQRERLATRLKLSRLRREGTRDLLAALFAEEITPEFLEGIYDETEGNPFFVEEVCKALVDSGEVYFQNGRWHRPPSMDDMVIPQSVRVAIQSRVRKLPADCQAMLQLAAILGREFEFDILAEAGDLGEDTLIGALECAGWAQLIEEVGTERDVTFAFTHGLIPATLAEGVSTLRRRRLRRRAASAIERLRPDSFEALAFHYGEAGDEERAQICHTRAGERASAAYTNVEAEHHFRAALDLVVAEADRGHLLSELGIVLARQGRYEVAIETWSQAITLYTELGDQDAVAQLYARSARAAWYAGETPRSLALSREGLAAVSGAPESPALAGLLHETGCACHFNGLPDEARSLCRQALEMAERLGATKVQAESLNTLAILPDQPTEAALSALVRAIELAESAGLLAEASRAHNNLGVLLTSHTGDFGAARDHFLQAAELGRQRGAIAEELFCAVNAASVALFLGAFAAVEEEIPSLRRLLDAVPSPGATVVMFKNVEALLARYRGQVAQAVELLRSNQTEARGTGDLQALAAVDRFLGEALLELGMTEEAEAALEEAMSLGDRGVDPFASIWSRCVLSVMRSRQGATGEACRLISEARDKHAGRGERAWSATLLMLAEAHLAVAESNWPAAWRAFEATTDGRARMGMRWYRAQTLVDWAKAHLARGEPGDRERAQALFGEAEAEFKIMGVPLYAAQVREGLAELEADT
jgi:predicted ATPase